MPNTCCDLHLHTYYSDGQASPAEVLHHAATLGLKTVAITDHDNLNAAGEAAFVAGKLGLELVPGIELTSRWEPCLDMASGDRRMPDVDVLGYFFDPQDADFIDFTRQAMADLRARLIELCDLLGSDGYAVNIFDAMDENPRYPGAVQIMQALKRKGYVVRLNDALPLLLERWPKVRPARYGIAEVIRALHSAGGVAVLAHPVAVRCRDGLLSAERVEELVAMGLDGLEVYHPTLDPAARQHFLDLAARFHLAISGGSDEHGWEGGFTRMGSELVTYEMVKELKERSKEKG